MINSTAQPADKVQGIKIWPLVVRQPFCPLSSECL